MEFLDDFGISPILLLAQIVNFTILLFILKRFLYKPIMKVLEERKHKIETSMNQANEIQRKLEETESSQREIIGKAESAASNIIEEAKEAARKLQEEIMLETNKKVEESITKNKEILKLEREKMVFEVKSDMANLVAETTKKVLGRTLSGKDNEELVKKSLENLKS